MTVILKKNFPLFVVGDCEPVCGGVIFLLKLSKVKPSLNSPSHLASDETSFCRWTDQNDIFEEGKTGVTEQNRNRFNSATGVTEQNQIRFNSATGVTEQNRNRFDPATGVNSQNRTRFDSATGVICQNATEFDPVCQADF